MTKNDSIMQLAVYNKEGETIGKQELPPQFETPIRADVIKRAVFTLQSNRRQQYGAKPEAGKRASAIVSKRRSDYKTTYGIGQSRTPRKVMSHRGTRMNWVGAFAPQTVGGRRAHPPKAEKEWDRKLNKKENRYAIRSALHATIERALVSARGHHVPDNYPFLLDTNIESISKTGDVISLLEKLGLGDELARTRARKIRAGRGKMRGRRYRQKTGPLLVTGDRCSLSKAASNIRGVDTVAAASLNAELLAPGCSLGRLTLYTASAIEKLKKEKLFM